MLTDIAKNSKNPVFKLVAKAILAKGLPFDLRIRTDFTDGKVAHYSTDGHFVEFDPSMPAILILEMSTKNKPFLTAAVWLSRPPP